MTALASKRPVSAELADEEIVRRVVVGEIELFELLMRRHNQRVYRSNAYRHLHQFEGRSSFATWLTMIAIREATGRNRKTLSHFGATNIMSDVREPSPDPEERAVAADLMQHVEAEVAALPEGISRRVVVARSRRPQHRGGGGWSRGERGCCEDAAPSCAPSFGAVRCDRVVARVMEQIRTS